MNTENDNKYEVGVTPDDNNDRRLPGSVNPEPIRGDGVYDFAQSTPLKTKETGGIIGVSTTGDNMGMEGNLRPSLNSNVDITNSDTTLMATASTENLSKKFKYPQVKQDVPPKGDPSATFEDHL